MPKSAPAPRNPAPAAGNGPQLSLCMIVRNSAATLRPCLESIRPWVDEMVVVDTGSRDETPAIARELGATVHDFDWCDDFSAARNFSLDQAHGTWLFWMDSDDTIPPEQGARLRAMVDQPLDDAPLAYVLQVRCPGSPGDDADGVTSVDHVKLFRNLPELRFEGRIHEQILPAIRRAHGTIVWTDIFVDHSGSDQSPAGRQSKYERDLHLLRLELQDRPDHTFTLFNLGMTYADMGEPATAAEYLEKSLQTSLPDESHVPKIYALLVGCYSALDRQEAALATCVAGRAQFPEDRELLFRHGILLHHAGACDEAEETYLCVLAPLLEERRFASVDEGIGSYKARHNLALVYMDLQRPDLAEFQWRRVVQERPSFAPAWRAWLELLLEQGRLAEAEVVIAELRDHPALSVMVPQLAAAVAQRRGEIDEARTILLQGVADHPEQRATREALCRLLFEHGPAAWAVAALDDLCRRFPQDGAAWHNLGTAYGRAGCRGRASRAFAKSLAVRPQSVATLVQWGRLLEEAGEYVRACQQYCEARRLAPDDPTVQVALAGLPAGVEARMLEALRGEAVIRDGRNRNDWCDIQV